jgi:hypothetical protein
LGNAVVPFDRREDFVREITVLWRRAQTAFLKIGDYLEVAKERLPHGEFNAMIERELPFSPRTAYQIRAAAQAVRSGKLPTDRLPPNYTTIYHLSTLPDAALEEAKREGLIRPDVRRSEVIAFKKRVSNGAGGDEAGGVLRRRLGDLRRQRDAIDAEIARLEAEAAREVGIGGSVEDITSD